MKAMTFSDSRDFVWREVPEPQCHDEFDVKLAVKACAVNRADLMQRAGIYAPPPGWPEWPGLECAGVVLEAPEGGRFKPGDAVCALLGGGGYAERVVVPQGMCMPLPRGYDFARAAGIPEVYATAYLNLRIVGGIARGETFFINGGEGGLGVAAIQLAKHVFGAKVVAQVASDENAAFCRGLGADVACNRFKDDLVAVLSANPPDVAIDPVGGPLMGKCISTMNVRGRWISLASMAGPETVLDVNLLWRKNLRVIGSTLRSRTSEEKAEILAGLVREVWPALESGAFAPHVHAVMPVSEAAAAHALLETGKNRGKVVLSLP
ncbi:MAG: NAD(P)H-quinone oxidoreductase [Kiritimatiellae bacterium]|nr:NAD(P)H-quinone oxidoreductase [Kiritimatiellia bacterium]